MTRNCTHLLYIRSLDSDCPGSRRELESPGRRADSTRPVSPAATRPVSPATDADRTTKSGQDIESHLGFEQQRVINV